MATQVPKWLHFFKNAGIPLSLATNYAVLFCDHRIQDDMLPELSKEILRDMGITVMGDVIAILRHAKEVHAQSEREKAAKAFSSPEPVLPSSRISGTSTPPDARLKKETAASRMVDSWINNQRMQSGTRSPIPGTRSPIPGTRSPSNAPRPLKKKLSVTASELEPKSKVPAKTLSDRFSGRLGAIPSPVRMEQKVVQKVKRVGQLYSPSTGQGASPVVRPISAKKTVTMASVQKKSLATKQKQTAVATATKAKTFKASSVFDRLGEEPPSIVTPLVPTTITPRAQPALKPLKTSVMAQKKKKQQVSATATNVFSRLGELSPPPVQQVTISPILASRKTLSDDGSDEEYEDGIDYTTHSVLRPIRKKETVKVKPVKQVQPVKRCVGLVSSTDASGRSVFTRLGPK